MASAQLGAALRHINRLYGEGTLAGLTDARLLERYVAQRDELAFEGLVQRHGPMVMAVCRGILADPNDADDAFQASFLLLARKAGSLWANDSLGGWLHRVACRIAWQVNSDAVRRRDRERRAAEMASARNSSGTPGDDVKAVLQQEIDRLPERYRKPIVLCYLEEMTYQQAASQLRWSEGTTRGRLQRARDLLRTRLTRRGVTLASGALAALSGPGRARAVSAAMLQATVQAARHFVLGEAATVGIVSTETSAMVRQALKSMMFSKLKMAGAAALVVGALTCAATGLAAIRPTTPNGPSRGSRFIVEDNPSPGRTAGPARAAVPAKAGEAEMLTYRGRVLGPDGQRVPGAKLYLTPSSGYLPQPFSSPEYATTGSDGRFEFTVPTAKYRDQATVVAAAAPNHCAGWVQVLRDGKRDDLTLQLVEDDVPITGQIIDLEGKPVPGATIRVLQINAAPGEDLGPWLEAVKGKQALRLQLEQEYLSRFTVALSPIVTTDAEGRFRLSGIGRNRLVAAQLDGPAIVSQQLHILTRPGKTIEVPENKGDPGFGEPRIVTTYYGASFQHAAAPTKPIVGVVRDKETKKPLAGITIRSHTLATRPKFMVDIVRTTTDAEGRYRLIGMPKGRGNRIVAVPGTGQPYVVSAKDVPDSPGLDPVTVNVELKRAVMIEGNITDKLTGKPVQGVFEYFSLYSNPNLSDYDGFVASIAFNTVETEQDGSYQVAGLPGPGLVAVFHKEHYLRAPERDDEYGVKETPLNTAPWAITHPINYSALARIDPAKGVDSVKRDVTLDPGWSFKGTVIGPDGEPLAGTRGFGLRIDGMNAAVFTVSAFNPRQPRVLLLRHPGKGLVGVVQPPKENGGSVTVQMQPGATVTGRLVDADGKPRVGIDLKVTFRLKARPGWERYFPDRIKTDRDGRFRIEALAPGYEFRLSDGEGELPLGGALRAGETKDLAVQFKRAKE